MDNNDVVEPSEKFVPTIVSHRSYLVVTGLTEPRFIQAVKRKFPQAYVNDCGGRIVIPEGGAPEGDYVRLYNIARHFYPHPRAFIHVTMSRFIEQRLYDEERAAFDAIEAIRTSRRKCHAAKRRGAA